MRKNEAALKYTRKTLTYSWDNYHERRIASNLVFCLVPRLPAISGETIENSNSIQTIFTFKYCDISHSYQLSCRLTWSSFQKSFARKQIFKYWKVILSKNCFAVINVVKRVTTPSTKKCVGCYELYGMLLA